jgi:hypothetical protein
MASSTHGVGGSDVPARRIPKPPRNVTVASLADTGDPATDRVMIQAEQNLQDLQDKARAATATATAQSDAIATLQGQVSGRLLAPTLTLTGSGSDTLPAGTCVVVLDMIGQGGGGGGAVNGSAAASGGLSGWRLRTVIGTPGVPLSTLTYSWSAGSAGGGGGSAAGGNGTAGADTTATVNGTGFTAKGGSGGIGSTGAAAVSSTPIAAPGTGPVGLASFGQAGPGLVMALATAGLIGGAGGGTDLGAGGEPIFGVASTGNAGSSAGFGGGGSGAVAINPAGFVGGAGAPGVVLLTPYS